MDWLVEQPIAHRGLHSTGVPENSLAAFEAAIEANYAIELDVRLTRDDVPVVFHDARLRRMTGHAGPVSTILSDELAELRLADTDEPIPRLSEVLEHVDGDVPLLIEVKNEGTSHRLEAMVADSLTVYDGEFAVQSFNPISVSYFRRHHPSWLRGQIGAFLADRASGQNLVRAVVKRLIANPLSRPDFVAYDQSALPSWPVSVRRTLGVPVLAWTVRTHAELSAAREHADNVIFEEVRP